MSDVSHVTALAPWWARPLLGAAGSELALRAHGAIGRSLKGPEPLWPQLSFVTAVGAVCALAADLDRARPRVALAIVTGRLLAAAIVLGTNSGGGGTLVIAWLLGTSAIGAVRARADGASVLRGALLVALGAGIVGGLVAYVLEVLSLAGAFGLAGDFAALVGGLSLTAVLALAQAGPGGSGRPPDEGPL